jgi:hypothetical protein
MQISIATFFEAALLVGFSLLVLMKGGPYLVNVITITGLWAGPKVMSKFATIPASYFTSKGMDGFNIPSAVHNMDNI